MTHRERVLAAFNNQPVDRVPFSFWFHFIRGEDTADAMKNPELLEEVYEGHKRYIAEVQPDLVKVMSDSLFRYPTDALYNFKSVDDFAGIEVLKPDHPWMEANARHAARIKSIRPESCFVYNTFSPSMLVRILNGEEKFFALYRENPQKMSDAVQRLAEGLANMVTAVMKDGGMDGLYYCVQNQNIDEISDEDHEKYFGAADRMVLDVANAINDGTLLHVCGYEGRRNNVDKWTDYPAKAVNWAVNVEGVPLPEGKKLFGGRAVVGGFANTSEGLLHTGTEAQIRAATREIVESVGKTGLVVAADCSLPHDIDWQHLIWVREELEAIG